MDPRQISEKRSGRFWKDQRAAWQQTNGPRNVLRFLFFGCLNTLIAYGLYVVLLWAVPYMAAYTIAYACGIFISYGLNAKFVFNEKLKVTTALQYPLVYVVQYLLGLVILRVLIEGFHVSKLLAPFVVALLMIPVAYKLSSFVIRRGTLDKSR
ncbi:MAG: GtrA family protein [Verrucomicrobiota bacterium]